MGRYMSAVSGTDEEVLEVAESMFERLVGYRLAVHAVTEEHAVGGNKRSQVRLEQEPRGITRVIGYSQYPELRYVGWDEIDLGTLLIWGRVISIPPSIFGMPYEKVKVTYLTGAAEIGEDVVAVVSELYHALKQPGVDVWNASLSGEAAATVEAYRKQGEGGGLK